MTYSDCEARWKSSGGAARANYGLSLQDLCDLLEVPRSDPTTQNQYLLERAVQFNDGPKKSTGRIDLYKRGCFVLETKQAPDTAAAKVAPAPRYPICIEKKPISESETGFRV